IVQLQFTKDTLPDSVSNDFLNINKFNEQQFTSLTEIVFNFLLEPKEQLSEFAEENGMSAGPLRNRMKSFMLLPYGALKKNLTADQAAHFSQQWSSHYPVLSRLAVGQTLMVNQLVDMEWKFGGKTNNLRIEVPLRMVHSFVILPTLSHNMCVCVSLIYTEQKYEFNMQQFQRFLVTVHIRKSVN
uniref:COMM domain containing 7 n=1 Tax=Oncorhynchus mykiss TaxID=8022 RepID=A0A8C7QAZ1_ONCMY